MTEPTPGLHPLMAARHRQNSIETNPDVVIEECPIALVFNGISHAVMMATPTHLEEFALGFALSEGIITHLKEIFALEIEPHPDGWEIQIDIAQSAFVDLKQQRRTLAGRSGCGVCGIESLQLLDLAPEPITAQPAGSPDTACIAKILAELPARQPLMRATGGAHAAAWCHMNGDIVQVFEDVGRHNALDKLLGWLARQDIPTTEGFVLMTSRASYELVRKIARRNIAILATISAPTSLAVQLAQSAGIQLLSFCRPNSFVRYPDQA